MGLPALVVQCLHAPTKFLFKFFFDVTLPSKIQEEVEKQIESCQAKDRTSCTNGNPITDGIL
jgi:hypothetical protein